MWYDYSKIEGYKLPLIGVIGPRGVGKTFGVLLNKGIKHFVNKGERFVYVVETKEMVDTLAQNKGEKFFSAIIEHLEEHKSAKNKWLYSQLFPSGNKDEDTSVEGGEVEDFINKETNNKIIGGTIKIHGDTAGYIIAINDFANIKRNNFVKVKYIIIDEFIPENIDIRHLSMPRKLVSIIQSVARLKDVIIYMLGNSIRPNDITLVRLGCDNMKPGEFRVIKDKYGPLGVFHMVDINEYKEYAEKSDASVSGRLASKLGEDNLDKNEFKQDIGNDLLIPDKRKASHLLFALHGETGSVRIHTTKDYNEYYVMYDYGKNRGQRICLDEKYTTPIIKYDPEWKEVLMLKYTSGQMKFESSAIHLLFKGIMKLNL